MVGKGKVKMDKKLCSPSLLGVKMFSMSNILEVLMIGPDNKGYLQTF